MKLLLMVVGNAAVLLGLWRWLRAQRQIERLGCYLLPMLGLRLLAGVASVVSPSGDAKYFQNWSKLFTAQLWAAPRDWWHTLASDAFYFGTKSLVFHGYSNTFFMMKLLSWLNVITGGALLLNALYLSLFCFMGCWLLVRELSQLFPSTRGAAIVAFLVWPSAVYWSSGVTKESLLLASAAGLVAAAVVLLYGRPARWWGWVLLALGCAWLNFKMRFFFSGALLGVLGALTCVRVGQQLGLLKRHGWQALVFGLVLAAGTWLASEVSPIFRFNKFASQLTRTYTDLREKALDRPHIALPELTPTVASMLRHTPKAVGSALFRPFAWEGDTILYGFAACENLGLLLLLLLACGDWLRRRTGPLPFALALALLVYCLLLAALLGLTTPNLGTLNRYRAAWLPMLVYLLMSQPAPTAWLRRLRVIGIR